MIIIHGEHLVNSRRKLVEFLDAQDSAVEVIRMDAKKVTLPWIEEVMGSQSLFTEPKLIVIEELHSLPRSKLKNELIDAVAHFSQSESTPELILWEKRSLTKTMLKKFAGAQEFAYKVGKSIFSLVEKLEGELGRSKKGARLPLLHQAIQEEDAFFVMSMITRQIRMLIQAKDGGQIKAAPFVVTKLKSQARSFSLEQLLKLHKQLLKIDLNLKTSGSALDVTGQLDLLLWSL